MRANGCALSHGITIGSVWYDDVINVTFSNVELVRTRAGPRIKGRMQGNGTVSGVHFKNVGEGC